LTFGPICEAWHGERADTTLLRRPITADIPALVAAGEFDPVTPPAYGRLVAGHLPRSRYFEARGMGHGALPFTQCARDLTLAFLDAPDRPLDTACLDALPGVSFITDVHVTPGVARLVRRLTSERSPGWSLWAGTTVLVLVWAVVGWPFVLALGVPSRAAPLLWIPWGVLVLTAVALVFTILAWRHGWWTRSRRIGYGLVSTACASFLVLVAGLGLFAP
jgi:hypothetical protein